jgi:hypothetical protein
VVLARKSLNLSLNRKRAERLTCKAEVGLNVGEDACNGRRQ